MSQQKKPLKRHSALKDLSREHQRLLVEARSIRWVASQDRRARPVAEVVASVRAMWEGEALLHLREEEEVLIPFCVARDGTLRPLVRQILYDHNWLREQIERVSEKDMKALSEFGRFLHDHIRFEERVVFEHIQSTIPHDELNMLAVQLRQFRIQNRLPSIFRENTPPDHRNP